LTQRAIHKVADRWFAQLNASVTSGDTTWVLKNSGATGLPAVTASDDCVVHCGSEKVLVTAIDVDVPSAGLDTLTVERGYSGSTAASHASDAFVGLYYYEGYHNDLAERVAQLERFVLAMLNDDNVIIQDGGLLVLADGATLVLQVTPGGAIVDGHPVALRETVSLTLTAPTGGDKRIDTIRISQYGVVSVVTGTPSGSPAAPAAGTGYLKLAEVYLRTGATLIDEIDDTVNGYVTQTDAYH